MDEQREKPAEAPQPINPLPLFALIVFVEVVIWTFLPAVTTSKAVKVAVAVIVASAVILLFRRRLR